MTHQQKSPTPNKKNSYSLCKEVTIRLKRQYITTHIESMRLNPSSLYFFRYSNLILNLFSLMVDANIPDIALEPDKTVKKVHFFFYFSGV